MKRRTLLASTAALAACRNPFERDIDVPAPDVWRTDLLYGYFGCMDDQVTETKKHINLFMESNWMGLHGAISNILSAQLPTILDVSWYVFNDTPTGDKRTVRGNAAAMLHGYFTDLARASALRYVRYLYPMDEPNNTVLDEAELMKAIELIDRVASEYTEIRNAKLAVIYATDKPYIGLDAFDFVGIDHYDVFSRILLEPYQLLRNQMRPGQQTILVPGGQSPWKQDPLPFLNFAERNSEVGMLLPFLWCDLPGDQGIRSNNMAMKYVGAGRKVITAGGV